MKLGELHSHESRITRVNWQKIGLITAILYIAYFLAKYHLEHVIEYLPFLFILACPLMHFFMHRKHGEARHQHGNKPKMP